MKVFHAIQYVKTALPKVQSFSYIMSEPIKIVKVVSLESFIVYGITIIMIISCPSEKLRTLYSVIHYTLSGT